MRASTPILLVSLAIFVSACGVSFPPEEIVEKDRPLVGRVVVVGDETRTTPAPGETARYEFLVASPGVQAAYSYLFVACPLVRGTTGIALCDTSNGASLWGMATASSSDVPTPRIPSVSFTVPDKATLGAGVTEAVVLGAMCPGGPLDPALTSALATGDFDTIVTIANPCLDKTANGLLVSSPFPIELAASDRNHAPFAEDVTIAQEIVTPPVAGTPFTTAAPPEHDAIGCATEGYFEVKAGSPKLGIVFRLDQAARETYDKPAAIEGEPPVPTTEVPYVRGYASAGDFGILIDNQQTADQLLELTWTPPTNADETGTLVRFWFLVRDDRQGDRRATSWVERALCVVPPPAN